MLLVSRTKNINLFFASFSHRKNHSQKDLKYLDKDKIGRRWQVPSFNFQFLLVHSRFQAMPDGITGQGNMNWLHELPFCHLALQHPHHHEQSEQRKINVRRRLINSERKKTHYCHVTP